MITRRALGLGVGLGAVGLQLGAEALAQSVPDAIKGPWTKTGSVRRAGGQLAYGMLGPEDSGKPPIILLHKLGGWMADWRLVAPSLAVGRQVIAFDMPGHGQSRWLGPPPYIQTLGETAALLVGAFDELGLNQVDLIGTSLGGCASVPLAAFWPERVRRLALVSSALGGARTLQEIAVQVDQPQKSMFDASGMPLPTTTEHFEKVLGIIHSQMVSSEVNLSRARAGLWIQPSERGVAITDLRGLLPRIQAPTLLMYGQRDTAYVKFRTSAEAVLKHGRTEVVPNSGAYVMQDSPDATASLLKAFVDMN